jgi:RNA polymerase sigma-70 factor, ECF subfamily
MQKLPLLLIGTTLAERFANKGQQCSARSLSAFYSTNALSTEGRSMGIGSAATADVLLGIGRILGASLPSPSTRNMGKIADSPFSAAGSPDAAGSAESSFALLLRAKGGDPQAREELFSRYLPRVRRWAHGRLPAHSRSLLNTDDLAQEVLCRAVMSLERFAPQHEGAFQGFLRQIMLNRVRDEVRRAGRRPTDELVEDDHFTSDPSPVELAIGQEALERYEAALQRLKLQERELIVARCELDFSNEEIAALFDKPTPAAARVAIGRALAKLAEEMARG